MNESPVLLVTRDPSVIDVVSATALALGVDVDVVADREQLRVRWPGSTLRLVGSDLSSRVVGLVPGVGRTYVVGPGDARLFEASAELRAPAFALPDAASRLGEAMAVQATPGDGAQVVALVGASGGLGVSTVTAALGVAAAGLGRRTSVVDLAPCSGGLDLLLGAEAAPGLRWEDLRHASGSVGDLAPHLVHSHGLTLLTQGRDEVDPPGEASVAAVTGSLARTHEVMVVDAGAGESLGLLGGSVRVVLVAGADVRSVAAGRLVVRRHRLEAAEVVVRTGPGRSLPPTAVAEALGLPLRGVVRHHRDLPGMAAAGAALQGGGPSGLRRDVKALWQELTR